MESLSCHSVTVYAACPVSFLFGSFRKPTPKSEVPWGYSDALRYAFWLNRTEEIMLILRKKKKQTKYFLQTLRNSFNSILFVMNQVICNSSYMNEEAIGWKFMVDMASIERQQILLYQINVLFVGEMNNFKNDKFVIMCHSFLPLWVIFIMVWQWQASKRKSGCVASVQMPI